MILILKWWKNLTLEQKLFCMSITWRKWKFYLKVRDKVTLLTRCSIESWEAADAAETVCWLAATAAVIAVCKLLNAIDEVTVPGLINDTSAVETRGEEWTEWLLLKPPPAADDGVNTAVVWTVVCGVVRVGGGVDLQVWGSRAIKGWPHLPHTAHSTNIMFLKD